MTKILSDVVFIKKELHIEQFLKENYGEIVRWAIVDVTDSDYKIAFSYEVKEAQAN